MTIQRITIQRNEYSAQIQFGELQKNSENLKTLLIMNIILFEMYFCISDCEIYLLEHSK